MRLTVIPLLAFALSLTTTAAAQARDRSTSGRSRLELSFDHGYGFATEGQYVELAADLRLYAPFGLGAVLRTGAAVQGPSNALALDVGVAGRFDLLSYEHFGLQLGGALGPSLAAGPFDGGNVLAFGGWALVNLDFWFRNFFVGLGVSGHALVSERYGQEAEPGSIDPPGRTDPILSLTPLIRIGGDWGL